MGQQSLPSLLVVYTIHADFHRSTTASVSHQQLSRREVEVSLHKSFSRSLLVSTLLLLNLPRAPLRLLPMLHETKIVARFEFVHIQSCSGMAHVVTERRFLSSHDTSDVQALWRELGDPTTVAGIERSAATCRTKCVGEVHFNTVHLPLEPAQG